MPRRFPSQGPAPGIVSIFKIVLVYATFAALWILLSDKALEWLSHDVEWITLVSILKGWLFIAVTSVLLYGLMRRLMGRSAAEPMRAPVAGLRPLLSLAMIAVAIIVLTAGSIVHTFEQEKDAKVASLQAIADLKARQIGDWLRERDGDAHFAQSSRFLAETYNHWRDAADTASGEILKKRLNEYREDRSFQGVLLLDEKNEVLWDSQGAGLPLNPVLLAVVRLAAAEGKSLRAGPYRGADGRLHLDLVAPLLLVGDHTRPVVVLDIDPEVYLFPTLQTWPVPSPTGETLLFRRDGDDVLFLNELRHHKDAAAMLRVPVADKDLPASKVLRGEAKTGSLVEGVDYRGVPVMGVARSIPGTDWFLAAKMDQAEAYADAIRGALWIGLAGLLALFVAAAGAFLFRQQQELSFSLREREIQAEKLNALQLLDAIVEGSGDAIFAKDLEGRYMLCNQEAARVIGKSPQEVLGKDDMAMFPPEQAALLMACDRKVMEDNRAVTFQENLTRAGVEATFLATKGPLRDAAGNVIGIFGISRDITERVLAEEALRASEVKFRLAYLTSPDSINLNRVHDGMFVDINEGFTKMTGYEREDVMGKTSVELNIWDDPKDRERLVAALKNEGFVENMEARFHGKNGRIIIGLMSARLLRIGQEDVLLSITRDITERNRAEVALRESEERFALAMEATKDGLWDWNLNTNEVYYSPGYAAILGYEPGEIAAHASSWADRIHPEDKDAALKANMDCIENRRDDFEVEFRMQAKNGEWRWILGRGKAVGRDRNGRAIRMVGTHTDITERKRAEEERSRLEDRLQRAEKMEALGTLAGGVAHDLNNVLGIVVGYSELLLNDPGESGSARSRAVEILKGGQRAAAIVQDLLTLARRGVSNRKVLNLNNIILECQNSPEFAGIFSYHSNIRLKTNLEAHLLNISGSDVHLGKSLLNLVSNAAEAMPQGGAITIKTRNQYLDKPVSGYDEVRDGDYVVLSVSDTGEGIPAGDLKRIFEPFYTKKVMGRSGTGLGLAVIWGTVKDHSGYINVESQEGKGTIFTLYFPVTREEISREQVSISAAEYIGNGESILIVDDVKEQRELAGAMLKKLNYSVASVAGGEEAVEYLKQNAVDLVVLDMIMDSGIDGLDTYAKILEIHPHQRAIIVSGFSETDRVSRAQALGAGTYVKKPYIMEKLGLAVWEELKAGLQSNS